MPFSYYEEGPNLKFCLFDVGEGLMQLIVFPDLSVMLFDCNITDENKDQILIILEELIPERYDKESLENRKWIDVFVNSHRDEDHYRGLIEVNTRFPIKSIWDSGQSGATTDSKDYKYYMSLRRAIKAKYGEDSVIIPQPSSSVLKNYGGANIYCLNSSLDYTNLRTFYNFSMYEKLINENKIRAAKIQHTNSIVLSILYGLKSIMLTGDSDWKSWKDKIIPKFKSSGLLKTNILIASHHGSRSFFTDEQLNDTIDPLKNPETTYIESIEEIKPSITLISCGEYESAHHPNEVALKLYKENTANEQVYTTCKKGHVLGIICGNDKWTVVPNRFKVSSNIGRNFTIKCEVTYKKDTYGLSNNSIAKVGSKLHFTITSNFGITDPYGDVSVIFEVSNGGINSDHEHQEIYYKGSNEKVGKFEFYRDLSYEGKHLLRCYVNNKNKKIKATQIFVVNAVL